MTKPLRTAFSSLPDGISRNSVLHADCLAILPTLPDGCIDAIITDPVWPDAAPELPGRDRCLSMWQEACTHFPRLTTRLVVILGCATDPRFLSAIHPEMKFLRHVSLNWTIPRYRGPILVQHDCAYVFGDAWLPGGGIKVLGGQCTHYNRNKGDIDIAYEHPTPRSPEHMDWLIRMFTRPGQLVFDPFCGSGRTLVAAKKNGRDYLGIDICRTYADLSRRCLDFSQQQDCLVKEAHVSSAGATD